MAADETPAPLPALDHAEFVQAWRRGRVAVRIDPVRAPRFLSARLLLPLVAIAVIGIGIALVLSGQLWLGIAVGAIGILVPRLIKRGAIRFLLAHIGEDADLYRDAVAAGVLELVPPQSGQEE